MAWLIPNSLFSGLVAPHSLFPLLRAVSQGSPSSAKGSENPRAAVPGPPFPVRAQAIKAQARQQSVTCQLGPELGGNEFSSAISAAC